MTVEETRKIAEANTRKHTTTIQCYIDALNRILSLNAEKINADDYTDAPNFTLIAAEEIEMNGVLISFTRTVVRHEVEEVAAEEVEATTPLEQCLAVYDHNAGICKIRKTDGRPHIHTVITAIYDDDTVEELTWRDILNLKVRYMMILDARTKAA